jgi:hypothetical protein
METKLMLTNAEQLKQETDLQRLASEIAILRAVTESAQKIESEVNELRTELSTLKTPMLNPPAVISGHKLNSLAIDEFLSLFPDFRQKCIRLVWRSSRDGLQASTFHNCYDDHANTLIIIEDMNGNIFGGYVPQT